MKAASFFQLLSAFFLFCCIGTAWGQEPAAPAAATLTSSDCIKCHEGPSKDIATNGAKHKTEVSCQDCHVGHPPKVKKPIPTCAQCHSGTPHYALKGCSTCHANAHAPKVIKFGNNVTDACVSCHTLEIQQLKAEPSKHTALACSMCHNVHGKIPACTQCHKPHGTEMTQKDCSACHTAHKPNSVTYKAEVPTKFCAACHSKAAAQLKSSTAKHNQLPCAYCHQAKHKAVSTCTSCHGTPHPAAMMARFPNCGECHSTAHDLNRWGGAPAKGKAKPAAPAAKGEAKPAPAKKASGKKKTN